MAAIEPKRLGVLGGGQLGRMMAQAASRIGVSMTVLDPAGLGSPAGQVCGKALEGSFTDPAKIKELSTMVDVITVEIEHIDTTMLTELAASGVVQVHPAPATLRTIQDKLVQKRHLSKVDGVKLGDFAEAESAEALLKIAEEWGYPLMLKARTFAYDGRGNAVVNAASEVASAFAQLSQEARGALPQGKVALYVERWCAFECELAVMVARSVSGEVVAYPTVVTEQRHSMCHAVVAPAEVSLATAASAKAIASAAISSFEGAGIFGVELFAMADGSVLLNEIAPRPHNSGHYTLDACYTEQHEMHLRAVLGMPLGDPSMKVEAVAMLNVIGDGELSTTIAPIARAMAMPRANVHWYGKAPPKARRKMGHINVCASSVAEARSALKMLELGSTNTAGATPLVGVIMGSDSDLPTMRAAAEMLEHFGVSFELTIVSAHRTPQRLYEYATSAEQRGLRVIIAGAGGAAHLPGMAAAMTPLPVIGVPVKCADASARTSTLSGNDSLLSIVQMPKGVPVATVAIGNAANAGLLAVRMLGMGDANLRGAMAAYMKKQEGEVLDKVQRLDEVGYKEYAAPKPGM